MSFISVVIAGGALKVISVIGCIKYLEEKSLIKDAKNYVGKSAGAIMCLLLVLGFNYVEILEFLFNNIYDSEVSALDPEEYLNIMSTYGMSSGAGVEKLLTRAIENKLKVQDITFLELAKITGKNLVVCVTNLSKDSTEFFDVDTASDLSIVKAIKASCAIPILYSPVCINDNYYVDGMLFNNFPINYFKDQQVRDVIGINITAKPKTKNFDNLWDYLQIIINSLLIQANKRTTTTRLDILTLEIDDDEWVSLSELTLKFPKSKWSSYIQYGYKSIKLFLDSQRQNLPDPSIHCDPQ
jgi:predicted acylesterase/phospholipase RssA